MLKKLICLSLIALLMVGCKTKQVVVSEEKTPDYITIRNEANISSVSAKLNIKVPGNSLLSSIKGNLKVNIDSALCITINPILGIELARLCLDKDSITFIDRRNMQYAKAAYTDFSKNIPLSYEMLQGIICNRTFNPNNQPFAKTESPEGCLYKQVDSVLETEFLLQKDSCLNRTSLGVPSMGSWLVTEYSNFGANKYPSNTSMMLLSPTNNLTVEVTASQIEFNKPVSADTNLSRNYKRTDIDKLIGSFIKF